MRRKTNTNINHFSKHSFFEATPFRLMNIQVVLISYQEAEPLHQHTLTLKTPPGFGKAVSTVLSDEDFLETPLLRPREKSAGLYAYHNVPSPKEGLQNVRATRLAMACGLFSLRFWGDVLVVRSFGGSWQNLSVDEIFGACCLSPDLRPEIQNATASHSDQIHNPKIPLWLADAAQNNYHDAAALQKIAKVMDDPNKNIASESIIHSSEDDHPRHNTKLLFPSSAISSAPEFVTRVSLCLQCRRPSSDLCPLCKGAYFCSTNKCFSEGWSHSCLCPTWQLYANPHRLKLSQFEALGAWHLQLVGRPYQISSTPYEDFISELVSAGNEPGFSSWWQTESGGWVGEQRLHVDPSVRLSYAQGFAPIADHPPDCPPTPQDVRSSGLKSRNSLGMLKLVSWSEYYNLRHIPPSSPVALLCTFPLTLYEAITHYGEVPATVARILKRALRVHIIGAEKEVHFLDLFKEVGYLLPQDFQLELVFVVRDDMLPLACQSSTGPSYTQKIQLASNLTAKILSGTYGDSLDPKFDCGGPPDMLVAFNAGLFAYESWRSVINFLLLNPGVVGVFSDYNEHSGVHCASLGGSLSRNSLRMNPFRQPRAMPVYSMNLPQFSNGFLYVYNQQKIED